MANIETRTANSEHNEGEEPRMARPLAKNEEKLLPAPRGVWQSGRRVNGGLLQQQSAEEGCRFKPGNDEQSRTRQRCSPPRT